MANLEEVETALETILTLLSNRFSCFFYSFKKILMLIVTKFGIERYFDLKLLRRRFFQAGFSSSSCFVLRVYVLCSELDQLRCF